MNFHFKPLYLKIILVSLFAFLITSITSLFMKDYFIPFIPKTTVDANTNFKINKTILIQNKVIVKKVAKKTTKYSVGQYLLKDFAITATFVDGKDSLVIIRDGKGGIFINIGEKHKGYKLERVYINRARFIKNGNIYIAFLSPKDEKEFKTVASVGTGSYTTTTREKVTESISREMFEDIKFKDGKYYIPKDMMLAYKDMGKIFSSISIQAFSINNDIKYKVRYVKPNSIFSKMGLKKYDFITQVNNQKFKSISEPIKYFQNLENLKDLSLTILRGNKTQELKYEIY